MKVLEEGFFNRLISSFDRVLFGLDLILSLVIAAFSICMWTDHFTEESTAQFIQSATSLTTTLIIVTVTSVSILVSLSNSTAITSLKGEGLYEKFLFTFEFTAILALLSSVIGVIIRSFGMGEYGFQVFVFFFVYTVLAAATVISRLITYGDKVAQISLAQSLPDDLDEQVTEVWEDQEED